MSAWLWPRSWTVRWRLWPQGVWIRRPSARVWHRRCRHQTAGMINDLALVWKNWRRCDRETQLFLATGLPSFSTVLHYCNHVFNKSRSSCTNSIIIQLLTVSVLSWCLHYVVAYACLCIMYTSYMQWLKYGGTRGNAVPPPPYFSPKHSPTSNFQKRQGNAKGNARECWHLLHFCPLCSELFITLGTL